MKIASSKQKSTHHIQWPLTIISIVILLLMVGALALRPDEAVAGIDRIFQAAMSGFGPFLLLFDVFLTIFVLALAFSRYGRIKLGDGKPEYSMFSYIAMMACAALASASMFWSFTEWAYYVVTPGLNFEAHSREALEISLGYAFFHWGFWAQCIYALIGVVSAYALYVRKQTSLKLGSIAEEMMGQFRYRRVVGKIIDLIVMFCTLAGLGVSLGLGIPVIAGGINRVTGLDVTFGMQVIIVLVLAVVFSWSSFVGTGRGMKFLSDNTVKLLFILLAFIVVVGPTEFIQKIFVSSLGTMVQLMPSMATFTDPLVNGGFSEAWTIFFVAFPLSYTGLMGVFVAKISKGRTIRSLVLSCMLGISIGTWVFFAVDGGLAMYAETTGQFSIIEEVMNGDPYRGVFGILDTLPLGTVSAIIYSVCVAGFICTTLDAASLCLASTTTNSLDKENNPGNRLRLFWCLMLTLVPLAIMFSGASFDALKQIAILVSCPLAIVLILFALGFLRWLKHDRKVPRMLLFARDEMDDMFRIGRFDEETEPEGSPAPETAQPQKNQGEPSGNVIA